MSHAENMFEEIARAYEWEVHTGGWPSHWIEKDGFVTLIVVRSRNDELKHSQIETMYMLEQQGLTVRVYCGSGSLDDLLTLEQYLAGEGARALKPLSPQAVHNLRTEIRKLEDLASRTPEGLRREQLLEQVRRKRARLPKEEIALGKESKDLVHVEGTPENLAREERLKAMTEESRARLRGEKGDKLK